MKALSFAIGIFLVLGVTVFAQNITQNITLAQPGLLPDNPLHFFQSFYEQLQLFFAFNSQAKANVHLQLAEKRLAEMNLALQENKTDLVDTLSQDYDNEMNQTNTEIDNAKGLGQNVTALAEHVAEATFKHQLVLQNVLAKVPDQAKSAIENAIDASDNGHYQAVESIFESRNITGIVNVTFTIDNQTFTQTFNITIENGKTHIERNLTNALIAQCENSGGTVVQSICCKSVGNFPNTCLIGACSCSSDNSHTIKVCQCPQGECWNGNACISTNATTTSTTTSISTTTTSAIGNVTSTTTSTFQNVTSTTTSISNITSTSTTTSNTQNLTSSTTTTSSINQPIISEISPASGPVGTNVTITGSHFTIYSNFIVFNRTNLSSFSLGNFSSPDTMTLQFIVPLLNASSYLVSVMNSNGISNAETFTVS